MAPPGLTGTVAVVSPHLDDAILSLGASLRAAASAGADVRVVTVFGRDPGTAAGPPSEWDARCGFASAADAAVGRREEDRRACARVGVTPLWLPYVEPAPEAPGLRVEIAAALAAALAGADTVLVPGFPLEHPDHVFAARLAVEARTGARLGLYVEQPYAAWAGAGAPRAGPVAGPPALGLEGVRVVWSVRPATVADRLGKLRAGGRYRSQLRALGRLALVRVALDERRAGGERIGWLAG